MTIQWVDASFSPNASYSKGDTVTLTVDYTSTNVAAGATAEYKTSLSVTDATGATTPSGDQNGNVLFTVTDPPTADPTSVSASDVGFTVDDPNGHTWTTVSNTMESFDGTTASWKAVFTTTA